MKTSHHKTGFTLIELLLVMAIIAVLASLSLAVVNDAQYDAKANATRTRISLINSILQQKLEGYQYMRAPIKVSNFYIGTGVNREIIKWREIRRRIVAEFINVEMPQDERDLGAAAFPSEEFKTIVMNDNEISNQLIDSLAGMPPAVPGYRPATAFYHDSLQDQDVSNTEFLYAILETTQFNGVSAVEVLGQRSFADTDLDGLLEVVDSWGNPITFQFEIDENGDGQADAMSLDLKREIDIRTLRVRLFSTGNGFEQITT